MTRESVGAPVPFGTYGKSNESNAVVGTPLTGLSTAVAYLPTEPHRAAFRLLVAATVARWHLGLVDPSGWPSFVLVGPSKTAKTLLALGACRVFGLDPARHVRSLPTETERSTWGRLVPQRGGGWAFVPSKVLGRPLAVWDEHDKADRAVQRSILRMLQGEVLVGGEGDELVTVRPTVVLTSNAGTSSIPSEYLRRSVVLDTAPLVSELVEVHSAAGRFLDALPLLDLEAFVPPISGLPEDVTEIALKALREGLSDEGWRSCDERSIDHLALGMVTLAGDRDVEAAAFTVVADYLSVARTVTETADPVPAVLPGAQDQQALADQEAARARRRRQEARRAALAVAERREALRLRAEAAVPDLGAYGTSGTEKATDLASRLGELARWAADAEDKAELDELEELVNEAIAELATVPLAPTLPGPQAEDELAFVGRQAEMVEAVDRLEAALDEAWPGRHASTKAQLRWLASRLADASSNAELDELRRQARPVLERAAWLLEQADKADEAERRQDALRAARDGYCPEGFEGTKPADALVALGALEPLGWEEKRRVLARAGKQYPKVRAFRDRAGMTVTEDRLSSWGDLMLRQVARLALSYGPVSQAAITGLVLPEPALPAVLPRTPKHALPAGCPPSPRPAEPSYSLGELLAGY